MPKRPPAIVLAVGLLACAVLPAFASDDTGVQPVTLASVRALLPAIPTGLLHPEPGLYILEPQTGACDETGMVVPASCSRLHVDAAKAAPLPTSAVVLIHGLDDTSDVWREVAPALHDAGRCVLYFEYPNDQSITLSADALAESLRDAHARGIQRIDLVCHSMGGLVARDLLTRADHYAGLGDAHSELPDVDRVVLVATPNAGAPLAWVRGPQDLIERTMAWRHADAPVGEIFRLSADGDGQAGIDLRPGSAFLEDLNARPAPTGITLTVIIAQAIGEPLEPDSGWHGCSSGQPCEQPCGPDCTSASNPSIETAEAAPAPRGVRHRVRSWWSRVVRSVIKALGDGAVPMDSAALASADETLHVRCSHVGLLKEDPVGMWILDAAGQTVQHAPAVSLVLERVSIAP